MTINIGDRFSRWTVIGVSPDHSMPSRKKWLCECACGKRASVLQYNLKGNKSRSCGCASIEIHTKRLRTHGGKGTRLYRIWLNMRKRCFTPSTPCFKHYGGRGITVCTEWQDFAVFRDWATSNGYREDLTIEREDNDGNYSPNNCVWATVKQQGRNRRTNRAVIRSDGVRYGTIQAAAEDNGCSAKNIGYALAGGKRTAVGFGWAYAEAAA